MKLKKIAALCASSCMAASTIVPVYASGFYMFDDYEEIEKYEETEDIDGYVTEEEIEKEQGKDEEFDEEYGLEDSDTEGDPFLDIQDVDSDKKYCCNCGCCIEEPDEPEDDGYICDECKIIMTKEEMERNAKELASIMPSWDALKKDARFIQVYPEVREEMENGDIMAMADAMYIYVWLSDEIYTWYEVTPDGIMETPNLRFSTYAEFYRYQKVEPSYVIPDYITAFQGSMLGDVKLPNGWNWQKPDKVLDELGDVMCYATYSPENRLLYKTIYNIEVNVEVVKNQLDVNYPKDRYIVSYMPEFKLDMIQLPEGWHFEEGDRILDIGSKIFVAVFDADDNYDYTSSIEPVKIRVDVKKSIVTVNDFGIKAYSGTVLTDDLLPKMNGGHLEWDVAQRVATKDAVYTCHFVPDDLYRYYITKNISVSVSVINDGMDDVTDDIVTDDIVGGETDNNTTEDDSVNNEDITDTGKEETKEDEYYTITLPANNGSVAPPDKNLYEITFPVNKDSEDTIMSDAGNKVQNPNPVSGNADVTGKYQKYDFQNTVKDIVDITQSIDDKNTADVDITEDINKLPASEEGKSDYLESGNEEQNVPESGKTEGDDVKHIIISWDSDGQYHEEEADETDDYAASDVLEEITYVASNWGYYSDYRQERMEDVILEDYEDEDEDEVELYDEEEEEIYDEIIIQDSSNEQSQVQYTGQTQQNYGTTVNSGSSSNTYLNSGTSSTLTSGTTRTTYTSGGTSSATTSSATKTNTTGTTSTKSSFTVGSGSSSGTTTTSKTTTASSTYQTVAERKKAEEEAKKAAEANNQSQTNLNLNAEFNDDEEDPTTVINSDVENTGKNTAIHISGPIGGDSTEDTSNGLFAGLTGLSSNSDSELEGEDGLENGDALNLTSGVDTSIDESGIMPINDEIEDEDEGEDSSDTSEEETDEESEDNLTEEDGEKKKSPVKTIIIAVVLIILIAGLGFGIFKLIQSRG